MDDKEISYQDMQVGKRAFEQSVVLAYNPPMINEYEMNLKGSFDQSGMSKK